MRPRIKKLIGTAVLLPVLVMYFFAAAALGEQLPDINLLKAGFYLLAGIAWAFPTKHLIGWMNADPKTTALTPERD